MRISDFNPPFTRALTVIIFGMLFCLTSLITAQRRCGTLLLHQRLKAPGTASGYAAKVAAAKTEARTLLTAHFAIHYSLRGLHKVKLTAGDSLLQRLADSAYAAQPASLRSFEIDANVYKYLDDAGIGHPKFIVKSGEMFENSWAYFVDSIGMQMPVSLGLSKVYNKNANNRYNIVIADVGTAEPMFRGQEIYALTYPPGYDDCILMDNDFLYTTSSGTLDTIQSVYNGVTPALIINYARDWEKGIQVTAAHEFYHSVQYTYTPDIDELHFWYEASATAMEEQLAPDVNDYLQYLPSIFTSHSYSSLTHNCSDCLNPYGNSIFHSFLTHSLNRSFDLYIWQELKGGSTIKNAMKAAFQNYGKKMRTLYPKFTQPFLYNQSTDSIPFEVYTADLHLWPALSGKTLDMNSAGTFSLSLPPLTYETVQLEGLNGSVLKKVTVTTGNDLTITSDHAGQVVEYSAPGPAFTYLLPNPKTASSRNLVLFSNGSWDATASITIESFPAARGNFLAAYPNPISPSQGSTSMYFVKPYSAVDTTVVIIFNEYGDSVTTLSYLAEEAIWSWDLTTSPGKRASPGVYYYQTPNQPMAAFLLTD